MRPRNVLVRTDSTPSPISSNRGGTERNPFLPFLGGLTFSRPLSSLSPTGAEGWGDGARRFRGSKPLHGAGLCLFRWLHAHSLTFLLDPKRCQPRSPPSTALQDAGAFSHALEFGEAFGVRCRVSGKHRFGTPTADGDAAHIALATVHGLDVLLTWNCRHIANVAIQQRLRRLAEKSGYTLPSLATPEEFMND